jgi:hypothetical protein
MKFTLFYLLIPLTAHAQFGRPELVARLSQTGAWNAPDNTWCFSSEPGVLKGQIHLGCLDESGSLMAQWSKQGFKILARAQDNEYFSQPLNSFAKISWYSFNEWGILRSFESSQTLEVTEVSNLGPLAEANDNLLPLTHDSWIYRIKGNAPELWIWKKDHATPFFNPGAAFIFTPKVGPLGEVAFKVRDLNYDESSPDRLWHYNGSWKIILEDQDANPSSPWIRIRHQLSVEEGKVLAIAQDAAGEALILLENSQITTIARTGKDLASFDYFSPKMRSGTIVVRGVDFEGRKATYVYDGQGFRKLLTQGDPILTDSGLARVHYHNQDAIFYGAPGIDEEGNIVLQATLTDADHPTVLLGIGIIRFTKE